MSIQFEKCVFPITRAEADALHAMGWESGYGWYNQFDWFRKARNGYYEWLEDRQGLMEEWLADLAVIRQEERKRAEKERLGTVGPELLEALEAVIAIVPEEARDVPLYANAIAAIKKARQS